MSARERPEDPELDALVRRTEGLQPGRRLFHATWGVVFAVLMARSRMTDGWLVATLALLLAFLVTADVVRLRVDHVNRLFFRWFRLFASPREEGRLASSTWYVAGVLIVAAAFPRDIAIASVLVLALADPAASYVGRRWGRRPIGSGTLLGTATFWLVAVAILSFFASPPQAATAAALVAVAEVAPVPIDDNVVVPVATGLALILITSVL